jgi:predicted amidohydrolase YtcJ
MSSQSKEAVELILQNGRFTTLNPALPEASAVAVRGGRFVHVGTERSVESLRSVATRVIDLGGRRVIPGLNDSHTHVIRGGLTYNAELRWEGVTSVGEALELLRRQAQRTAPPQWVRVVGGWSEFQFKERRMPTLEEINEAAPDTPVFVLHLYSRALLNRAALRALGYDESSPAFDRGFVERDARGRATGMLIAKPSAQILYRSLGAAPPLSESDRVNSTRQFMRELNRLGVTSAIDAGGGGQNYPDDYAVVRKVHAADQATVRIAYNLFAQKPSEEHADYERWVHAAHPGQGDDMLRLLGAGENLVWAAADFENFLEPRPALADSVETDLESVVRVLAAHRWPFRIHATYDESIRRFLDVFEKVDRDLPLHGLHWAIDHAETISTESIERVHRLGGGIAIQHRMAFQGEYFAERYGKESLSRTPPLRAMLERGVVVGAGTDATRVASYNPWVSLYWLTTGRTLGGLVMYGDDNVLTREEALRLWTVGSAWFSSEDGRKGAISEGQLADLAVLSADYFAVADEAIKSIQSLLTVVGGRVVHAAGEFSEHGPGELPVSPDWSPVSARDGAATTPAAARFVGTSCQAPFGAGAGCDCFTP